MKEILKKIVVAILTLEARAVLLRYKPKIIVVAGSVGKTSTKDAVYAVMAEGFGLINVRKSQKSMNSEIGLPLTILGLENAWTSVVGWFKNIKAGLAMIFFGGPFPEWLVLEIGADHPGDIEKISKWLRPDILVLTRMSDVPAHLEFFRDADQVLQEDMFLAQAMRAGGSLVINADDPHFMRAVEKINIKDIKKVFYGQIKSSNHIYLLQTSPLLVGILKSEILYDGGALPLPVGQRAIIKIGDMATVPGIEINLGRVVGQHLVYPILAATAVAEILGIASAVPRAFHNFENPKGRMYILDGINSSAIIDDSYNSSPLACSEALNTMARLSIRGKKIGVLADMKELGSSAEKAHRDIGVLAGETLHTLVTVGEMAKFIAEGAIHAGMSAERIMSFDNSEQAGIAIREIIRAGDVVLVKGSQSMRMERAVKALLAEPFRAGELLVRQEEEWGKR